MDFSTVKGLTIPEGEVIKITCGTNVLWEAITVENKWNLLERTEFRGQRADATFYFNPTNSAHKMNLSEDIWINGGMRYSSNVYYYSNYNGGNNNRFSTLSNITENSFTLTSGSGSTELTVAFPFH